MQFDNRTGSLLVFDDSILSYFQKWACYTFNETNL